MTVKRAATQWLLLTAMLPTLALAGGESAAERVAEPAGVPLRPYQVQYLTKNWGLKVKLTRELARGGDGVWDLSESGSAMMQKIRQRGQFRVDGHRIIPLGFTYDLTGVVRRKREVQFPTDDSPVRSLYKGKWYEFPAEPGMLDRQSQQEQIRLFLLNDPTPQENLVTKVVDGRKTKEYELVFEGEETLQTALGPVATLHFSRQHKDDDRATDIWLAPQWDYLMVRTLHLDEGTEVEAVITGGSIDGTPLSEIR